MAAVDIPGLACPRCHGPLTDRPPAALGCAACAVSYPVVDGIPSFLESAAAKTDGTLSDSGGKPKGAPADGCLLSIVILALDEAGSLKAVLPGVQAALNGLGVSAEILVVDGGSRDGSPEVARAAGARVVTQNLPGFGGALRTAFDQARGEFIMTLDADGSHEPGFLASLWAARSQAEIVIASRYVPGGRADMPGSRRVLSRVLNVLYRRGLSLPVRDLSSGFRLYARRVVERLDLHATDFDILEEVLIRALAQGYTVREIPFHYAQRLSGRSHARLIPFGISYLRTFGSMWRLRNSIASADYDARAYSSIVPLQRYWQRRRFRVITRAAKGATRVLDVGCGSSRILGSDPTAVGLDVQLHKLRYARRYGNPLVHGSIFALPFADQSFDCVICSEVIEHIPAEAKVFDELTRVLRPGGRLILGTPDYDRPHWRALEWVYGKVAPGGYADEHITHFSRENLQRYLESRGLQVEAVDYVCGAEMIFTLRVPDGLAGRPAALPVTAGLRSIGR